MDGPSRERVARRLLSSLYVNRRSDFLPRPPLLFPRLPANRQSLSRFGVISIFRLEIVPLRPPPPLMAGTSIRHRRVPKKNLAQVFSVEHPLSSPPDTPSPGVPPRVFERRHRHDSRERFFQFSVAENDFDTFPPFFGHLSSS